MHNPPLLRLWRYPLKGAKLADGQSQIGGFPG
jgi:hypothetical protein